MPIFPRHRHLADRSTSGHPASIIDVTPDGSLVETDVQSALEGIQGRLDGTGVPQKQLLRPPAGWTPDEGNGPYDWFGYTHYVSTTGSDANDGLTPETSFLTMTRALRDVGLYIKDPRYRYAGFSIYVGAGRHLDGVPDISVSPGININIMGSSEILNDGETPVANIGFMSVTSGQVNLQNIQVEGLSLDGPDASVTAWKTTIGYEPNPEMSFATQGSIEVLNGAYLETSGCQLMTFTGYEGSIRVQGIGSYWKLTSNHFLTFKGQSFYSNPILIVEDFGVMYLNAMGFTVSEDSSALEGPRFCVRTMGSIQGAGPYADQFPFGGIPGIYESGGSYLGEMGASKATIGFVVAGQLIVGTEYDGGLLKRNNGEVGTAVAGVDYEPPRFTDIGGTTYYVSTLGDDNNTGLSANAPFRNLGAALKAASIRMSWELDYDLWASGSPLTIQLADGDYRKASFTTDEGNQYYYYMGALNGPYSLLIKGNPHDKTAVKIAYFDAEQSNVVLQDLTITDSVFSGAGAVLGLQRVNFSAADFGSNSLMECSQAHMWVDSCQFAGAARLAFSSFGGVIRFYGSATNSASAFVGTPAYSAETFLTRSGIIVLYAGCFTNYAGVTGNRFRLELGGVIWGHGSWTDSNTPGNAAGVYTDGAFNTTRKATTFGASGVATFSHATSPIVSAKIGPATGQQHTIPAVTSDTLTLNAATQTLTNKTLSGLKVASAAAPSSAAATGTAGEVRFDANYLYYCVATNTWKRTPLSTW